MSYQLCVVYPETTIPNNRFRDLPELPPSLRTLNEAPPDDSRGTAVRLPSPPASERIADFATNDSTSVVYSAAPGFRLEPGSSVTFAADGLPKGVSIDKDTGHIRGIVDHSASNGFDGTAIYDVRVIATDTNTGADTFRYFKWTVSNVEPEARFDFGQTGENGLVIGNVINGFGKGAEVAIEDDMYMVRPSAFGAGRDVDLDDDPLNVSMVAGHPANVGNPVACPGGGTLTMYDNGDYIFRAPPASADAPAANRPILIAPYTVRDSEGQDDTTFLFLDQSNGASQAALSDSGAYVLASVEEVEALSRENSGARVARAAGDERIDLRGLLDDSAGNDISSLVKQLLVADGGAGRTNAAEAGLRGPSADLASSGVDIAPAADLVAVDYAVPSAQADVAASMMAESLQAGRVNAALS